LKYETNIVIRIWGISLDRTKCEGFLLMEISRIRQAMLAKDSSCPALAARSLATGSIPVRGPIVALFGTAPG
jgi:hypothetical protein